MPSLKETKGRIGSVRSTLKITSAMKLVSSAKLRKAQQAISGMLPYDSALQSLLATLLTDKNAVVPSVSPREELRNVAIVALSSNSSLCGGFNSNVVRKVLETVREYEGKEVRVTVIPVGRKMAESMRRVGIHSDEKLSSFDLVSLSAHPDYTVAARLAEYLWEAYEIEKYDCIELIYNHFISTGSQAPVREAWLPYRLSSDAAPEEAGDPRGWIIEPSVQDLLEELLPKTLKLKIYTVLLDSAAAEHAARTVAMQTATDNGEDLLDELTLEYNKGRQSKITSEILDLVGGSLQ